MRPSVRRHRPVGRRRVGRGGPRGGARPRPLLRAGSPGVDEDEANGRTGFAIRGERFAWLLVDHHGDGRLAPWVEAPPGRQEARVGGGGVGGRCFVPSCLGGKVWVGLELAPGARPDRDEVSFLLEQAWRPSAPTRAVAELDGTRGDRARPRWWVARRVPGGRTESGSGGCGSPVGIAPADAHQARAAPVALVGHDHPHVGDVLAGCVLVGPGQRLVDVPAGELPLRALPAPVVPGGRVLGVSPAPPVDPEGRPVHLPGDASWVHRPCA